MSETKPGATREQKAVGAWLDRASQIRGQLGTAAEQVPSVFPYFDAMSDAVACFIPTELHARSLDRAIALDVFAERRSWLEAEISRWNDAGLARVRDARRVLKQMQAEIEASKIDHELVRRRVDEARHEFRVGLADWDMKGSDAEKMFRVFSEAADVVSESGLAALPAHVDRALAELEEVRRRPDRGAVDNIPFWKLLILAAWLGWMIFQFVYCSVFGCAPISVVFWWLIGASHLVFFVLAC
jgi:hypothetical protein